MMDFTFNYMKYIVIWWVTYGFRLNDVSTTLISLVLK